VKSTSVKPAPAFSLLDQSGTKRSLTDFAGRWLVVYFYPEDDTPGCTVEACGFRDAYDALQQRGLAVVGISADSVDSHARFADKYGLNFPLLADPQHEALEAYGAWEKRRVFGREYTGVKRKSFLIDPEARIVREYPKVTPLGHAEQILADFADLAGEGKKQK